MDAGKSTLVAVLTQGSDGRPLLDNSRGSARMAVFRHKHEIETGRTSSISQQVLGYDQEGRVLNYVGVAVPTPADITAAAQQLVQFIDMGGHEKYLKTTLYGMTCMLPGKDRGVNVAAACIFCHHMYLLSTHASNKA
eukprot:GHUV01045252.1.p1 GENE.GHUV01045252.1~~GHUV01045252.1.p1  ORF type:complete len:137 (-),score=38.06 GHUV01045252.1:248-658(-)